MMRWTHPGISLSTKAVVALVVALFTVAALLTFVQYRVSTRNLLAGWETKSTQEARVLGLLAEPLVLSGDTGSLRRAVAQTAKLPDVHTVVVVNAGGTILASSGGQDVGQPLRFHPNGLRQALEEARPVRWVEAGPKGRVQYHLMPLQAQPPRVIGAILIGIDLSAIDSLVQKNLRGLLVVNGLAFSVLLLLFWAAIRIGVIRPLTALTTAMRSMPAASVATPLPVPSSDEIGLLTEAFNQMADALQKKDHQAKESLGSLRQCEFTLTVLNETIQAAVATDDLPSFYQSTVSRLVQFFEMEMGCIQTVEADGELTLQFQTGMPVGLVASLEDLAVARAIAGPVITSRRAVTHDLTIGAPGAPSWEAARMDGIRYVCAAPILDRGKVLGILMLATRRARSPSSKELELFSTVALEVGTVMSRKRGEQTVREALAAAERERARLDTLYATAPIGLMYVTPALTVERVNRLIADLHGRAIEEFLDKPLPEVLSPEAWAEVRPIFEEVVRTGAPRYGFEQEYRDPRAPGPPRYFSSDFHPDRQEDGSVRGVLVVVHDVTARKEAERDREVYLKELETKNRELKELAVRDPLTGLYNHRYFEEALAQEWRRFQRTGEPFTVIVMDVDAFKAINDRHGHEAGDRALRQVGATLSASLRETDLIARTGGDEFVALLPRTDKTHGKAVLEKVGNALKELRLPIPGGPVKFSISLGYATVPGFPPVTSAAELVRVADQRMYEAKRLASSGKADAG